MPKSLTTILTALTLSCSLNHTTQPKPPSAITSTHSVSSHKSNSPPPFSATLCWQSFQPYLFDDNLYRAAARFKPTAANGCYEFATEKASSELLDSLRNHTIEKYLNLILQYENNPLTSGMDELCRNLKTKMQNQYHLIPYLQEIYHDALLKQQTQFPWITQSPQYNLETKRVQQVLDALTQSLKRPYCDSNEFVKDIDEIP